MSSLELARTRLLLAGVCCWTGGGCVMAAHFDRWLPSLIFGTLATLLGLLGLLVPWPSRRTVTSGAGLPHVDPGDLIVVSGGVGRHTNGVHRVASHDHVMAVLARHPGRWRTLLDVLRHPSKIRISLRHGRRPQVVTGTFHFPSSASGNTVVVSRPCAACGEPMGSALHQGGDSRPVGAHTYVPRGAT